MWSGAWSLSIERTNGRLSASFDLPAMSTTLTKDKPVDGPHAFFGLAAGRLPQAAAALLDPEKGGRFVLQPTERFEAELLVLQVVSESPAAAAEELARFSERVAGPGARTRVATGDDPAAAIVKAVHDEKADVVVLGSAGMQGRKEFLLGNVPNRVSHNAPCTVVIVDTTGSRK